MAGAWIEEGGSRRPLLRPARPGFTHPTDGACFPLAPFCNRLRDGRMDFRGQAVRLTPNHGQEPHPLHGQAWLRPWETEVTGAASADMWFQHEPGAWPWRYEARQTFSVSDAGLVIALEIQNLDSGPMPAGLGLHPYFPGSDPVRVQTSVSEVLLTDDHALATGQRAPARHAFDLTDRLISGAGLDHGVEGWSGRVDICYPGYKVRMSASANAGRLQVFAPKAESYFCLEPVTHANDAIAHPESDWPGLGIRVLAPGESLRIEMHLQVLLSV